MKEKKIFEGLSFDTGEESRLSDLNSQQAFMEDSVFTPTPAKSETSTESATKNTLPRAKKSIRYLGGFVLMVLVLALWQWIDFVMAGVKDGQPLALAWCAVSGLLFLFILKLMLTEGLKLRRLKRQQDVQQQAQRLMQNNAMGEAKPWCEHMCKRLGVEKEQPSYDAWLYSLSPAHSDAEVIELYDQLILKPIDEKVRQVILKYASESAVLIAITPLALFDMLFVFWRNLKMINEISRLYGIELGYLSRVQLLKHLALNMVAAGVSELVIDASVDAFSADLAGKVSLKLGQGLGVGLLTARLGVRSAKLLRPILWQSGQEIRLANIRQQLSKQLMKVVSPK